jgi:hypothetical protein
LKSFKRGLLERITDTSLTESLEQAKSLPSLSFYPELLENFDRPQAYLFKNYHTRRVHAILRLNIKYTFPLSLRVCKFCDHGVDDIWFHFLYDCPSLIPVPYSIKVPYPFVARVLLKGGMTVLFHRLQYVLNRSIKL